MMMVGTMNGSHSPYFANPQAIRARAGADNRSWPGGNPSETGTCRKSAQTRRFSPGTTTTGQALPFYDAGNADAVAGREWSIWPERQDRRITGARNGIAGIAANTRSKIECGAYRLDAKRNETSAPGVGCSAAIRYPQQDGRKDLGIKHKLRLVFLFLVRQRRTP